MELSLHAVREAFMKTALAAGFVLALTARARADELLVGVVRDQDGAVVSGAPVTALDARGRRLGADRTAADGTFAITVAGGAAAVLVTPNDAAPLRLTVRNPAQPLEAIVRRYRAADLVPSPADIAALPSGSLPAVASVVPYRATTANWISDRGLALQRGVVEIEGLPFYRRSDGADATSLLPSHAVGSIGLAPSLDAVWYGDRAGGGVVDAGLFDRADFGRLGARDGALLASGASASGFAAGSWYPDGARGVAAARLSTPVAGASATVTALAGQAPEIHYAGVGAEVRAATQRTDVDGRLAITSDDGIIGTGASATGNVSEFVVDASGRGPDALGLRARWREESGALEGGTSAHRDAALVLGTTRGTGTVVRAALALAYGRDAVYEEPVVDGTALLPSLGIDTRLDEHWSLHAGSTATTLGTPGIAIARGSLGEFRVGYTDGHRLRADLGAFVEGDAAPRAVTRGIAASLGWEIAPRLSLRAWTLDDGNAVATTYTPYPGAPLAATTVSGTLRRNLVWLTWDAPLRIDLLVRDGALEGAVRAPLGRRYALVVGSSITTTTRVRTLSVGVAAR
ncbi:MAG TPA: carboxypeptidase-like regulatory domain-containing protein [Candidatus Limnocylindria bacterium]|nr:carboxypeptidase-like regulatory domain-containing protein [Candidatus Limnocylindria bacterium]